MAPRVSPWLIQSTTGFRVYLGLTITTSWVHHYPRNLGPRLSFNRCYRPLTMTRQSQYQKGAKAAAYHDAYEKISRPKEAFCMKLQQPFWTMIAVFVRQYWMEISRYLKNYCSMIVTLRLWANSCGIDQRLASTWIFIRFWCLRRRIHSFAGNRPSGNHSLGF